MIFGYLNRIRILIIFCRETEYRIVISGWQPNINYSANNIRFNQIYQYLVSTLLYVHFCVLIVRLFCGLVSFYCADYNSVRLMETAFLAILLYYQLIFCPKPSFNDNFVPLLASSPINNEISCKMRVVITRTPLYHVVGQF